MREYHCDSLKNLRVPDALVEKALAAPASAEPAVKPIPLKRILGAAAIFVFSVAMGTALYLIFGNIMQAPLIAAPASETAVQAIAVPSSEYQPSASTEPTQQPASSVAPSEAPSAAPTQLATTADGGRIIVITEITTVEDAPETPTARPIIPTSGEKATQAPRITPTTAPTSAPSQAPTVQPSDEPWEPPSPSERVEPATDHPKREIASIGFMVPLSSYTGSGNIYCRLYNSSGRMIGRKDLFDESHRVYTATGSGYLFLSYPLSGITEPLPADNYTLVFYDEDENDIYVCSAYLSRQ